MIILTGSGYKIEVGAENGAGVGAPSFIKVFTLETGNVQIICHYFVICYLIKTKELDLFFPCLVKFCFLI